MLYFAVLNKDLAWSYLSGTSPGNPGREAFLGTTVESWYEDPSQIAGFRKSVEDCVNSGTAYEAVVFQHPSNPIPYFYFTKFEFIGDACCYIALQSWEFPAETLGLTEREHEVIAALAGRDPKDAAAMLDVKVYAVYKHIAKIKDKLMLGNDSDLFVFAQRYDESGLAKRRPK